MSLLQYINDFLQTDLSPELQEKARRLLIKVYLATERLEETEQILTPMLKSSPTNVLNLINAALLSSKMGKGTRLFLNLKRHITTH